MDMAAVSIAYLRGARMPTLESTDSDFAFLGMRWRCFFDFGVGYGNWRAATRSA
jgi:hypothetical protein